MSKMTKGKNGQTEKKSHFGTTLPEPELKKPVDNLEAVCLIIERAARHGVSKLEFEELGLRIKFHQPTQYSFPPHVTDLDTPKDIDLHEKKEILEAITRQQRMLDDPLAHEMEIIDEQLESGVEWRNQD